MNIKKIITISALCALPMTASLGQGEDEKKFLCEFDIDENNVEKYRKAFNKNKYRKYPYDYEFNDTTMYLDDKLEILNLQKNNIDVNDNIYVIYLANSEKECKKWGEEIIKSYTITDKAPASEAPAGDEDEKKFLCDFDIDEDNVDKHRKAFNNKYKKSTYDYEYNNSTNYFDDKLKVFNLRKKDIDTDSDDIYIQYLAKTKGECEDWGNEIIKSYTITGEAPANEAATDEASAGEAAADEAPAAEAPAEEAPAGEDKNVDEAAD
jgi:hypothetical protein